MAGIRTVMVTTPALFGDLIKRLAIGRVDLDIVAELAARRALLPQLRLHRPRLVIIGLHEGETDALVQTLLTELPSSKIIALSHDGRSITGYAMRTSRVPLSDLSPDELINFIGTIEAGA